jgi:TRAP-type mannitol/chloroaromatic compound transport system substrate-binding protein
MTQRRRFIAKTSGAITAVAAAHIVDAPTVIAQPRVQWRMSTAWTPAVDVLQGAAQRLAKVVEETSGGRFRMEATAAIRWRSFKAPSDMDDSSVSST